MIKFFRKIRKKLLTENKFSKYLIYAIGEIILIVIGILIAFKLNSNALNRTKTESECQYINELLLQIENDMADINENIIGLEPTLLKLGKFTSAIYNDSLNELDSIDTHIIAMKNYYFFIQQTNTKINNLESPEITLFNNHELKDSILNYQNYDLNKLLYFENKYELNAKDVRNYYNEHFKFPFPTPSLPIDKKDALSDRYYLNLVAERAIWTEQLLSVYKDMNKKLIQIENSLEKILSKNCK